MFKTGAMFFLMVIAGPWVHAQDASCVVSTSMEALRAQVELERGKEQELQLLQLEVDRLKLEVEKKKAVVELGKIEVSGQAAGFPADFDAQPSVSLRYVFIAAGRKEAVLNVNGTEQRVKEGEAVGGRVVQGISAEGVSLKEKDGSETLLGSGT